MKKALYAAVGALDASVGAVKSLGRKARDPQELRKEVATRAEKGRSWLTERYRAVVKGYGSLAKRGQRLTRTVTKSAPAQRAVEQTKRAKSQLKGAATSLRKAVGSEAEATKVAAKKAG